MYREIYETRGQVVSK